MEVREITVHKFTMGDVDDPILYAAQPLIEWEKSERGQWVMEHAVETPSWHSIADIVSMGHTFVIRARLKAKDITFFQLKWGVVN